MKKLLIILLLFLSACSPTDSDDRTETPPTKTDPTVEEKDSDAPVVTVNENPTINDGEFNPEDYITVTDESSYTVTDDFDSVVDTSTSGEYIVTITVTDEVGNKTTSEVTVTIMVDDIAPELTLLEVIAVYNNFNIQQTIIELSDDTSIKDNITLTSNYNSVVTGTGTYTVSITATDEAGNQTSKNITIYKAANDLDQLFNYARANGYDYGSDATMFDETFYNGMLQMNVYATGKVYVFYTDEVDDYKVSFEYTYGNLNNFHLQFDQDYSTDYREFSFSNSTTYNTATHDVTIIFDSSSIMDTAAKDAAENYANIKGDEFFEALHYYFVETIEVPLH